MVNNAADRSLALREQQNRHCPALMLNHDEHGVRRFPLSDRIYTRIVNCHEVKMNSDGFQVDSRLPFQLPSKEKVNWTLGGSFKLDTGR